MHLLLANFFLFFHFFNRAWASVFTNLAATFKIWADQQIEKHNAVHAAQEAKEAEEVIVYDSGLN